MSSENAYAASPEDVRRMAQLAGIDYIERAVDDEEGQRDVPEGDEAAPSPEQIRQLLREMAQTAFSKDGEEFAELAEENRQRIRIAATCAPEVAEMLVLGYKVGIA